MNRQYVGARYVPKFAEPTEWSENTSYEALTICTYNNSSYTSKIPVPATVGNPGDNPNYWARTGDYNAQVEQYRQETLECKTKIDAVKSDINNKIFYVTPEMFGAVGDGITDDSDALNETLTHKYVIFPNKTYKTTRTLNISKSALFNIDMSLATINYMGTDCALRLEGVVNSNIKLGYINAPNGDCIELYSESDVSPLQYVNIYFLQLSANKNRSCIKTTLTGGWINEIRVHDGMMQNGLNGILLDHSGKDAVQTNSINGWRIYNVGFEGVTNGIHVVSGASSVVWNIDVFSPRCLESTELLIKSEGTFGRSSVYGSAFSKNLFDLSNNTKLNIYGTIIDDDGSTLSKKVTRYDNGSWYYNTLNYDLITFTLPTNDTTAVYQSTVSKRKYVGYELVYNDDLYYLSATDKINPIISGVPDSNGNVTTFKLLKFGEKSCAANRNILIRAYYED